MNRTKHEAIISNPYFYIAKLDKMCYIFTCNKVSFSLWKTWIEICLVLFSCGRPSFRGA